MNKRHIPGFFDALLCTPAFLFLCAIFVCGATAGGLTGLHAGEGDAAVALRALLLALPAQTVRSTLCAVLWILLPLCCAPVRIAPLLLSGIAAARGFLLALTVAVGIAQHEQGLLALLAAGLPAVLSVAALLAACTIVWESGETTGRFSLRTSRVPYLLCLLLAAMAALLRAGLAMLV